MKRIIFALAAIVLSMGVASAQDLASATETFNNGVEALNQNDKEYALKLFELTLKDCETIGEEAAEIAEQCKVTIPKLLLSIAKDCIRENKFDEGIAYLEKTSARSAELGDDETAAEATSMIPQVYMQKGNTLLKAKDAAGAADAYAKVLEVDPTNANAALRLGSALNAAGKTEEAIAAFEVAAANGKEKDANKQLSTIYLKQAQASLKAGKNEEVIELVTKSNAALPNANACKLGASAAQKLGKTAEMVALYEQYLELSPNAKDAAGVYYTLAITYAQMGNKAKAIECYEKVTGDPTYGAEAKKQIDALSK